jgi:hypothetical protein
LSWNHRDRIFAIGITIQPVAGQFNPPAQADLIGCSSPENGNDLISAADPTQTGTIWDQARIYLGERGTVGGTIPLRGPGGATPPVGNGWAVGRILQGCGFAEQRLGTATAAVALGAGSTTGQLVLNASEPAIDDVYVGIPIIHTAIGSGVRSFTLIRDYIGATKTAILAETLSQVPTGNYRFPAYLAYVLSTLGIAPPLLSISVWKDKKRYDYRDCVISSWSVDSPVANEANQSFPSLQFSAVGVPIDPYAATTPTLPDAVKNVPVPGNRGGKFFLDSVLLGHGGSKFSLTLETGAASNSNQDAGQDGYDILSGSRTLEMDLNQMDVTDFDLVGRTKAQTRIPMLDTWGLGGGNNVGMLVPNMVLDPMKPGARNGYVSLTGNGNLVDVDKSFAIAFPYL